MNNDDGKPGKKHKRGKRKKLQTNYSDEHRTAMIQQLERRFPSANQQPSSSSGSAAPLENIPLPTEVPLGEGGIPRLTAADYEGKDYMNDPEVVETHSAEIRRSLRVIRMAEEAERYMLNRAGTTIDTVLEEFRERVLEASREKRRRQTEVAPIAHPTHRKDDMDIEEEATQVAPSPEPCSASERDQSGPDSDAAAEEAKNKEEEMNKKVEEAAKHRRIKYKDRKRNLTKLSIQRKREHPNSIHPDIQYNEKGLGNENPECRCPLDMRNSGIRHGYYPGEDQPTYCIEDESQLYAYTLRVFPIPNDRQTQKTDMLINGEEYNFEGFSLVTHCPLPDCMTKMPICRYGVEYSFQIVEEPIPNGCFYAADTIDLYEYIFHEVFEMFDFNLRPKFIAEDVPACPVIHIMPRFVHTRNDVVSLWSTKTVLAYFLMKSGTDMFTPGDIQNLFRLDDADFSRAMTKNRQTIVLNAMNKPAALRADYYERDMEKREIYFIYNAIRYNNYFSNMPRLLRLEEKMKKMTDKERNTGVKDPEYDAILTEIQKLRGQNQNDRNLRVQQRVDGYTDTGMKPDMVAHVVMAILACHHVRYNFSLSFFEKTIGYRFNDRRVIELAMLHASLKTHYGTSLDHVKNLIGNCGYRRKYGEGERRERKKGVVNLFTIITGQSSTEPILHNERLEYLGDAVVELIVSHHLYFMLPHHYEGGLATYRTALVQNRNLADLALKLGIDGVLQYAHGAELCNEAEWKHALANAFEALMAAVFLDGGIAACDTIFSTAMYGDNPELKEKWDHVNEHELKRENPEGDRHMMETTQTLANFEELEKSMGIQFNNIRLLAKAFTRRNVPPSDLTKGHNQRLEWLGDSVLQLIVSVYLYKRFPLHHEGHMSLLRTSLVSNETQAVVCEDLGFSNYVVQAPNKFFELKMKDKADLVEAFIGALYVDRGLEHCNKFIRVVFMPRLDHFINNEKWNDAKSHLQQWCLLDRDEVGSMPEMPEYRLLSCEGPTNSRVYKVAVYFKGRRLASAEANNVHQAEIKAAELALASVDLKSISGMRDKKRSTRHRRKRCVMETIK